GWSRPAREAALARVQAMGLPGGRDEYWKFTRPDTLTAVEAPAAAVMAADDEAPVFSERDRLKVVFVDGVFSAEDSDDLALEGLSIERLAEASDI
ncbi:Fe-S cluster assembly protein SufD, partial [Halomonas marinisediminis]